MDETGEHGFEEAIVWQKAHQFVLTVFRYSDYFPQKEILGFTSQFRRAAISIATNIVELIKQGGDGGNALNALEERRYYLILARDLGYGENPELLPQLDEVGRLLKEEIATVKAIHVQTINR